MSKYIRDLRKPIIGKLILNFFNLSNLMLFFFNKFSFKFHSPKTSIREISNFLPYFASDKAEFKTLLIVATFDKYGDQ